MCFAGVYGQLEDRKLREEPADGREILERCLVTYIISTKMCTPSVAASFPANTKECAQQQASEAPKSTSKEKKKSEAPAGI